MSTLTLSSRISNDDDEMTAISLSPATWAMMDTSPGTAGSLTTVNLPSMETTACKTSTLERRRRLRLATCTCRRNVAYKTVGGMQVLQSNHPSCVDHVKFDIFPGENANGSLWKCPLCKKKAHKEFQQETRQLRNVWQLSWARATIVSSMTAVANGSRRGKGK